MKARGIVLTLLAWGWGASAGWTDPAVLIKAYPAEIIRGHYWLGKRMVRMGETVRVQSVSGALASVKTEDGDPLTVYVADLRPIAEKPLVASVSAPVVIPAQTPAPTAAPAKPDDPEPLSILSLLAAQQQTGAAAADAEKPKPVEKLSPASGERREAAVQCSGITKKGNRCTRMTHSPNGLCWQHGGD